MKFQKIKKVDQGKFITRYDLYYKTEKGREKRYEMISRDPCITDFETLRKKGADAVVMIIYDESRSRILLNREYRMAVGEWVYNFPAGLIDNNESVSEAAARELFEETGLHLDSINEFLKESYSAVGFSNEKCIVVVGTASGNILPSNSDMEEINAGWYTKAEIRDLLKNELFAARTQAYCFLWSKE